MTASPKPCRARAALAIGAALAAGAPAAAQDDALAAPLAQALAPVSGVENMSETLGCAALFRALSALLGPESAAGASFSAREGDMAAVSALLWRPDEMRADPGSEAVFAQIVPPLDAATGVYLGHMDATAAREDTPFDAAILSRVEYCIALHDALRAG